MYDSLILYIGRDFAIVALPSYNNIYKLFTRALNIFLLRDILHPKNNTENKTQ